MKISDSSQILIAVLFSCLFTTFIGYFIGIREAKRDQCTKALAYVPVNGKWMDKEVCLESLK